MITETCSVKEYGFNTDCNLMGTLIKDIFFEIKLFIKRLLSLMRGEESRLKKLAKLSRYTPGIFIRKDQKIHFPDSASFVFTYRELFHRHIYKFETENISPIIIDCGSNIGL